MRCDLQRVAGWWLEGQQDAPTSLYVAVWARSYELHASATGDLLEAGTAEQSSKLDLSSLVPVVTCSRLDADGRSDWQQYFSNGAVVFVCIKV